MPNFGLDQETERRLIANGKQFVHSRVKNCDNRFRHQITRPDNLDANEDLAYMAGIMASCSLVSGRFLCKDNALWPTLAKDLSDKIEAILHYRKYNDEQLRLIDQYLDRTSLGYNHEIITNPTPIIRRFATFLIGVYLPPRCQITPKTTPSTTSPPQSAPTRLMSPETINPTEAFKRSEPVDQYSLKRKFFAAPKVDPQGPPQKLHRGNDGLGHIPKKPRNDGSAPVPMKLSYQESAPIPEKRAAAKDQQLRIKFPTLFGRILHIEIPAIKQTPEEIKKDYTLF